MAIPTVSDIYSDVQGLLGEPAGGQIYTSTMLQQFYQTAFRNVTDILMRWNIPAQTRDAYYVLPADTGILTPAQIGIADFGEPIALWERGSVATFDIASVADTTPIRVVTTAPHGNPQKVEINGVSGVTAINQQWFVTVIDSTTLSLNGSLRGGAASAGGTVNYSSEYFAKMTPTDQLAQFPINQCLGYWKWQDDTFYFAGAIEPRELWIEYSMSGAPPDAGSVGIDNSRDFLAYRTAALACATRDELQRADRLNQQALGPSMQADGTGGFLRQLVTPMLKQKQSIQRRHLPFRSRRNNLLGSGYWPYYG